MSLNYPKNFKNQIFNKNYIMGRIGKISTIKKEYSRNNGSLEASLAQNGYQRFPGTSTRFVCPKLPNGTYQTGLDPNALYIDKMSPEEASAERQRVTELREKLERLTGIDLSPRSEYYSKMYDENHPFRAQIVRLKEGDTIFDLDDPYQEITWAWLCRHPLIARSWQAWERGEYSPITQFYVNDDNVEQEITYKKKTAINKSISLLESLSLERRKKVARLLGLPVTDNSKEIFVYNLLDSYIKQPEIKEGEYKGADPVALFTKIATMEDTLLHVKDLVEQALRHSIIRVKGGKIYDGHAELAKSKEDYVLELMKDKNQEDLLTLEHKLSSKKQILT